MAFKQLYFQLQQFATRLHFLAFMICGLLLSNLLTGTLAWYGLLHQKIEITPFSGMGSYQKSDLSVDNQYLLMMTENLIYSRFNVTPETVRTRHKQLLSFVDIKAYPLLLEALNKEARVMSSKKISSYFEIKDIQPDPKSLRFIISGRLKRATKGHRFRDTAAKYEIQYQYDWGRLTVLAFQALEARADEAFLAKGAQLPKSKIKALRKKTSHRKRAIESD